MIAKICVTCNKTKPIYEFGFKSRNKDGYNNTCKICCCKQSNESKGRHREDINKRRREDRLLNPEKHRAYGKRYYKENKQDCIERSMRKYHKQPDYEHGAI